MAGSQLPAKAQQALGLPEGFKAYSPFPFGGMNLQSSQIAMADQEFIYVENLLRIGDGYYRSAWDVGSPLYQAPSPTDNPIVSFFFYNIGSTFYVAVFHQDGSAKQVEVDNAVVTTIGPAGTFYDSSNGQLPGCSQWGVLYLLIGNRNTRNDYWAWDGSTLYQAGTAAPNGVILRSGGIGYTSAPTATAYGGSGSGMVLAAHVSAGSVVDIDITDPGQGYQVGDIVQVAFSGGGSDTSAILTASLFAGGVAAANITAGGSGYSAATVAFSGGGGTGAAATATVTGDAVTDITITNPGTGYTSAPSIVISGDGTAATAVAILAPNGVQSIAVTNGGTGFTSVPQLAIVGGGGAGATATAVLTGTSIARVDLAAGGSGYTSTPTVAFDGTSGGSGAKAKAHILNGQVSYIEVTNAGSGYTTVPTITITGGSGTGAAAFAVLQPTSIASVIVSAAGQLYTSAPAVEVVAGANNSAYANVDLMPYGVSGTCIETFQSRVWIADPADPQFGNQPAGGNFAVTAPGSFTDFATSDGGLLFTNSDSFLQTKYTGIRQSNGYLYFFGDGSVSVVSNVQTAGSPATTTFNYQNVDPQAGLSWRDSRQDFGRSMLVGNETGIYGLYGGAVSKVSSKLDKLFNDALFPPTSGALTPSGAVATLFNVKHYLNLMTVIDPDTGLPRNVMITWNERDWVVTSQTVDLIYIGPQKVESKLQAWGTDGAYLYPLFSAPNAALTKRMDTKQYGADRMFVIKDFQNLWMQAQDLSAGQAGINISVTLSVSGLAIQKDGDESVPNGTYDGADILIQNPSFPDAPAPYWPLWGAGTGGVPFVTISARLTSQSPDFAIGNLLIGYKDTIALT